MIDLMLGHSFVTSCVASRLIEHDEEKWLPEGTDRKPTGLGKPNFSSLAHLWSSVTALQSMTLIPLTKEDIPLLCKGVTVP